MWAKWKYDAPGITTNAQDIDWGAIDTDKSRCTLCNYIEEAQDNGIFSVRHRLDTVAALNRASVTLFN